MANPIPSPRLFELDAMSSYLRSSRRIKPEPSSTNIRDAYPGSLEETIITEIVARPRSWPAP